MTMRLKYCEKGEIGKGRNCKIEKKKLVDKEKENHKREKTQNREGSQKKYIF